MPTPGRAVVPYAKKKPVLSYELFLKYGGEGGIDSLRSPLLGPSMGLAPSGPTQALFKNAPGVFVGAARLLRSRSVQLAAPVVEPRSGVLIPPERVPYAKKKPVLSYELFLKYGGEGGIDSLRSPLLGPSMGLAPSGPTQALFKNAPGVFVGAARLLRSRSVQLAAPVVEPRSGVLIPPERVPYAKKKPVLSYELFLKYGGEGGIRTPDTLPYTHFPGVLLQPLGHLTILSCCSPWVGNGALL